jgi:hypothetical protein
LIKNDKINSVESLKNDTLLIEWRKSVEMLTTQNKEYNYTYNNAIDWSGGKPLQNAGDWRELVKSNQKQIESLNNKISQRESDLLLDGSNMESAVAGVLVSLQFIPNTKKVREAILRFFYGFLSILADMTATISFRNLIVSQNAGLEDKKLGIMGRVYITWFGNNPEMKRQGILGFIKCALIGTKGIRDGNKPGTDVELISEQTWNSEQEQLPGRFSGHQGGIEEGNSPKLLTAPKRNLVLEFMDDSCFDGKNLAYGKASEIQYEILKKHGETVTTKYIRNIAKTWGK